MTSTAAFGWAWCPGRPEPLAVELRLGDAVVAQAVADVLREDLASSGIGEGRHAFTLPVPDAVRPRLAELRVVARSPDGADVPLGTPPAEDGVVERLAQLHRGIDMLIGSHRVLHRNLQAALLAPKPPETASPAESDAAKFDLQGGMEALELFVVRLEQALVAGQAHASPVTPPGRVVTGLTALSLAALVVSAFALVRAMPG